MGFPGSLEFLLLGLELGDPALDLGALGRHRGKPHDSTFCGSGQFRRPGLCRRSGTLSWRWTNRRGPHGLGCGDPLYKRQCLFDQLVALTHPQLHHAYPRSLGSISPEVDVKINGIAHGMHMIGAVRDRLATARGAAALDDSSSPRDAWPSRPMKNDRFLGNRIAALRHFQPLHLFNSGVL
jgi:hypothetical protein